MGIGGGSREGEIGGSLMEMTEGGRREAEPARGAVGGWLVSRGLGAMVRASEVEGALLRWSW